MIIELKLLDKDIYERYRDSTTTGDNPGPFFPKDFTSIPKSPFDNVVGWIKLKTNEG